MGLKWGCIGGTILALCTALPEISTGIASAKIRDYEMAMSDILVEILFCPYYYSWPL